MVDSGQVGCKHILQKHLGSRNPNDSYRNVKITRTKEAAIENITKFKEQIDAAANSADEFDKIAAFF